MPDLDQEKKNYSLLRESASKSIERYFEDLDGQGAVDLYALVMAEVEPPMLLAVMKYNRQNQSKSAKMLGINRATLRKKLKFYNLI